jgi:hypothetical protein
MFATAVSHSVLNDVTANPKMNYGSSGDAHGLSTVHKPSSTSTSFVVSDLKSVYQRVNMVAYPKCLGNFYIVRAERPPLSFPKK